MKNIFKRFNNNSVKNANISRELLDYQNKIDEQITTWKQEMANSVFMI